MNEHGLQKNLVNKLKQITIGWELESCFFKKKKIVISVTTIIVENKPHGWSVPEVSDYTYSSISLECRPTTAGNFAACFHLMKN